MNRQVEPLVTREDLVVGFLYYALTSVVVVLGVYFGYEFLEPRGNADPEFLSRFALWDGVHYKAIADKGYAYDPTKRSEVAFFPVYPMLSRGVSVAANLSTEVALLVISHSFLLASFVVFRAYLRIRWADDPDLWNCILLTYAVFPTTFFFRLAYTESLFVFLAVLTLLGLHRGWPLLAIALVVGLATATRPVGVALIPALSIEAWRRYQSKMYAVLIATCLTATACWGLLGYIAFQAGAFGDGFAFAKTQEHWHVAAPTDFFAKLRSLAMLEPIWGPFVRTSTYYWRTQDIQPNPVFSLMFANSIFFSLAIFLVLLGVMKRWLTLSESLTVALLFAIPYFTRAYEMSMGSGGRFAAVAFPSYIVLGRVSFCLPSAVRAVLFAIAAFIMGAYSSLFSARYLVF